jgi:type III restriction enzyme
MARLKQWCEDINISQHKVVFDYIFVDEEGFNKYKPDSFGELEKNFKKYKFF